MTETPGEESPQFGMLRIHIRARDRIRAEGKWWQKITRRDLAHQIVRWAHEAGLPMAIVHRSHLGFIDHGPIIDDTTPDVPNPQAMVVIEIAGHETALNTFIKRHQGALGHAHIQFLSTSPWSLRHAHKRYVHPKDRAPRRHPSDTEH